MLPWWTRLSLITSAKSVRLKLGYSLSARIVAWQLRMLLIWAVVVSPIPLTASFVILCFLLASPLEVWLPECFEQSIDIDFSGMIRHLDQERHYHRVCVVYRSWFLRFYTTEGVLLLWRDSCAEADYRQLLVRLQRESNQSD